MKKFLFSLICLFVFGTSLFGWDVYSGADDATKAVLAKVDTLIAEEQYQSAFSAANGEDCQEEYLLAKRIEIATNYFAQSIMHQIELSVRRRCHGKLRFGVALFSEQFGLLGQTSDTRNVLVKVSQEQYALSLKMK